MSDLLRYVRFSSRSCINYTLRSKRISIALPDEKFPVPDCNIKTQPLVLIFLSTSGFRFSMFCLLRSVMYRSFQWKRGTSQAQSDLWHDAKRPWANLYYKFAQGLFADKEIFL